MESLEKKALCHELNEHKFFMTFDASARKKRKYHLPSKKKITFVENEKSFRCCSCFWLEVLTTRTFMNVARTLRAKNFNNKKKSSRRAKNMFMILFHGSFTGVMNLP